jgi:hypothetical protein
MMAYVLLTGVVDYTQVSAFAYVHRIKEEGFI